MHVPFFRRLSFRQARNVVLVAFALGVFAVTNQINGDILSAREESGATVRWILTMQRQAAAQAAWTFDTVLAGSVLEGLFEYAPMLEASIKTDTGTVLAGRQRQIPGADGLRWLADLVIETTEFSTDLTVPGKKEAVGTLSVRVDSSLIATTFFERALRNLLATIIPLILLAFMLVLMFYYSLTKPLFLLSSRLAAIDTAQPMRFPLEIPYGHQHDELGLLVATTKRLLQQFDQVLAERKAVEKSLQEAETKYRSIFDNAVEGIYQSSLDGRFLSANMAMAKAIGFETPEELMEAVTDIGRQLYVEPTERDEILQLLQRDGFIMACETRFYRKDGSILWGSQNARIVKNEAGDPLYIEGTVSDISAAKQAKEDLARVEAQLMQAQKMEALGNLAGGVAHDFNNLLQIISGYAQLLLARKDPKDQEYTYLNAVNQAANRAAELVKRMLTFSRKVDIRMSPLNLNDVIADALRLLERTMPKMIAIRAVLAPDLATIPADATQMEQVIMNLASNAVHAMEDNGTLTLETENFPVREKFTTTDLELDPGDYVLMKVTDTGKGMDEATRQRIFEPFFTTKEPGKGTGLGLASVYGIVTGHSGKIACYSEPGRGTTFKIFLPVTGFGSRPASTAEKAAGLVGGTESLLLVDDEEVILNIAGDILQQYGYTIRTAHSGEEALAAYMRNPAAVDCIIMDLGMAGMGGRKCLAELLQIDPGVRVIIASGYGSYDIIDDPGKHGAAAFISKPYRLDNLLTTVREVLDRPRRTAAG